jgi:hypothetical protein
MIPILIPMVTSWNVTKNGNLSEVLFVDYVIRQNYRFSTSPVDSYIPPTHAGGTRSPGHWCP